MYNRRTVDDFAAFIQSKNGIKDKNALLASVQAVYHLVQDRSVYFCDDFSVRFCSAASKHFSNTVLSLSMLQKYDSLPFIVCVVTPEANHLMLENTTFLCKISHSSQELRIDNIRGSFNGSDIMQQFGGIRNEPTNFDFLFASHKNYTFSENLERLVEATNNIHPIGQRFVPTNEQKCSIALSVERAAAFLQSHEYKELEEDLHRRVSTVSSEIAIAAFIDNVNLRGRMIEYLITSSDNLRITLAEALRTRTPLPKIYTTDKLGDYEREFENYSTATDIKTKVLFLSSNPKGYNIDKLLSFLAGDKSVYLLYIISINENRQIATRLCSMYNRQILDGTRIIKHWAGRNSRGVTQYDGKALENVISHFDDQIDMKEAKRFILECLHL